MNVIFTGFEPFGRFRVNPSYTVARTAAEVMARVAKTAAHELHVTWSAAVSARELADGIEGRVLLVHCGLAGERKTVSIERTARNRVGDTLDNLGQPGSLFGGEVTERRTRLDTERIAGCVARRSPVGAEVSDDAGDYICNATLWHSLGEHNPDLDAIFVHVPLCETEVAESIGIALGEGLIEALELGAQS